ncbi:MAG TPA: pilus assembly protein TadG-related protein [Sphingomonas sp.]|nr:pilus assembly protein TadG-related protein [Sphingomonas sp.]
MRAFRLLLRLARAKRGNVIVAAAASLPVVIGGAGLATDTLQWTLWKRQLQRAADSAALSGAYALAQSKSASTSATADLARTAELSYSSAPTIQSPPTSGPGLGNNSAVRIVVQTARNLPFSSLFLSAGPTVTAEATAAVVSNGNYCVISLEPTTAVGITMSGNSTVNMGCGMATNSRATNAVNAGGSSQITATPIAAVGGLAWSNNYLGETQLKPRQIPQADPYASLPDPDISSTQCNGQMAVPPHDDQSFTPGCYKKVDIKGTARLAAGVYFIDGGSFSVGAQGVVVGTGVTIILTSKTASSNPSSIATVDMNGGATIQLTAPTTSSPSPANTYAGVIFYQDRRAVDSGSNKINGNSSAFYQGSFYFPRQEVEFTGTSGMTTDCLQIVGRRVKFSGNSSISNHCPSGGPRSFTGTAVRLIG